MGKVKRIQLFVVFVDLRKVYDRVHRKAIFCKLRMYGVINNFLDSLKAMYNKVEMIDKIKNRCFDQSKLISYISCKIYDEIRRNFSEFVFEKSPNVKLLEKRDLFN